MELYTVGRVLHFLMLPLWMSAFFGIENQMRIVRASGALNDATVRSLKISRILMHISMTLTLVGGLMMLTSNRGLISQCWFQAKFTVLITMMAVSGIVGARSKKHDAIIKNQIVLHTWMGLGMIAVIVLAVLRPF